MAEESLKSKTVKGTMWSAIDNFSQYIVTFIVSIILARLLSPDDYGLIGIITIFTAVSNVFVSAGFNSALIRKKDSTEDDYNTVFICNLLTSLFLYALIFIGSPYIAEFFNRNELVDLTRVSALSIIVLSLAIVQRARLTKQIDFKTQTKITVIASISSAAIGIGMALAGCGVWSLVAQDLSLKSITTILLWSYNRWIPNLRFSSKSFHELFGYSWKLLVSSLLDTLWKELYQVVIGKFYNPASLGQYTRSSQFARFFSENLTGVIQRVTFPVLSTVQDNKPRMLEAYKRIIKVTMLPCAVLMLGLAAIADPFIYCTIGPKWHDAAVYLPYICISMSLYPLHAINLNMLQVQGRSDLYLVLEIIKKVIALLPLAIGAFIGIIPMLLVNIIVGIISYFLNSHWSGKFLGYNSFAQLKDVSSSYLVAIIVALSVYFLKYLPLSYWIILPLQIALGFVVTIIVCEITKLSEYREVKGIVIPVISKLKRK